MRDQTPGSSAKEQLTPRLDMGRGVQPNHGTADQLTPRLDMGRRVLLNDRAEHHHCDTEESEVLTGTSSPKHGITTEQPHRASRLSTPEQVAEDALNDIFFSQGSAKNAGGEERRGGAGVTSLELQRASSQAGSVTSAANGNIAHDNSDTEGDELDSSLTATVAPTPLPPIRPSEAEIRLAKVAPLRANDFGYLLAVMRTSAGVPYETWEENCEYLATLLDNCPPSQATTNAEPEDGSPHHSHIGHDKDNSEVPNTQPPRWVKEYSSKATPMNMGWSKAMHSMDVSGYSPRWRAEGLRPDPHVLAAVTRPTNGAALTLSQLRQSNDMKAQGSMDGNEDDYDETTTSGLRERLPSPLPTEQFGVTHKMERKKKAPATDSRSNNAPGARKPRRNGRATELRRGARLSPEQWTEVYVYILNVVASAPADPARLAHIAVQIMTGSKVDIDHRFTSTTNVTNVNETKGEDLDDLLQRAIDVAESSSGDVLNSAWREVLDWIVVAWIFRRGTALKTIDPKKYFKEQIDERGTKGPTSRSEVSQLHRNQGAIRWMRLAHALGDIAFLPLFMLMGDVSLSLDRMRKMNFETFGGLLELLQTGEDGRDDLDDLWNRDSTNAALRNAARFAAKCVIPATMGIMVKMLQRLSDTDTLRQGGVIVRNTEDDEAQTSFVGLSENAEDNTFPTKIAIDLIGSMGLTMSTPPNAALSPSYKTFLKEGTYDLQRKNLSWLAKNSAYGALAEASLASTRSVRYCAPAYGLVMGLSVAQQETLVENIHELFVNGSIAGRNLTRFQAGRIVLMYYSKELCELIERGKGKIQSRREVLL